MRITDLISVDSVELYGSAKTKDEAILKMIDLMVAGGNISDKEAYTKAVFKRESESTTGIGEGIAIPHAKSDAVKRPGLAAMILKDGVEFDSLDGELVHVIFLIAAPNTENNVHLDVLSKLSVILMNEEFISDIKKAKTEEEFLQAINVAEEYKDEADRKREAYAAIYENNQHADNDNNFNDTTDDSQISNGEIKKILAVTGCPTGIAHTYMAEESLYKAARAAGVNLKVETRGSGGAKNLLTDEDIQEADCIIVASDTTVPMARFNGKKVIKTQVSDGISKAAELINRAVEGDVAVYNNKDGERYSANRESSGRKGIGHTIYTHLMNGVSHMLPFVVGGGILIAIAFLIDGFSVDLESLPADKAQAELLGEEYSKADFGTITEQAALFKNIGGVAFGFMLPVLAGYIAMSIADRPGLLVGFVGGMIAANGKSGFLGALVAGFLAGYLILFLKKIFDRLPRSLDGMKPILLYPVFGVLFIGLLMMYLIEPPVGAFNTWLNEGLNSMGDANKIFLGIILAGMMAADMGGPINKAAYVFGTAMIAEGNYNMMAAVMIGGMVPPCAIALATLIFRNKFNDEERKSGLVNFIMGLAFITEGAIPYAASDPIRVLPSCVVGSAVAGAMSMIFECTLMAPHGGIFVFPVVGNALLYLVSLIAGTVAGALLLGILKRRIVQEG